MRQQYFLAPTLRDTPADAEVASHRLMLRAGLIRQLAAGIYTYLPLGYKVLRKIENIVREEMDRTGAQEMLLPALHPAEIWQETGRWDVYGPELMRLKDRHDRSFALGPTHEEVITGLLRDEVNSYKKLPLTLYQIQTKFRDERRPRFGMLRSREFIMKDAYSFDLDHEGLNKSYAKMYEAYHKIFERCGLDFRAVEADSGTIGGTDTHEFMVLSEIGEDTIAYCDACAYAANIEKAEAVQTTYEQWATDPSPTVETVDTPGVRTIEQLSDFLQVDRKQIIKSVALEVDEQVVIALVRGDYDVNELKVKNLLQGESVRLLDESEVHSRLHSVPGFVGPIGLDDHVRLVADYSVRGIEQAVVGANEQDKHLIGVSAERDLALEDYYDLRHVVEGDACPKCQGTIRFAQGIEVGHVFKLGTKYSAAMGATYLDEQGKAQPFVMGCYGIGVSRLLAAIIEQNHDEHGLIWPKSVTPFDIHLIAVNMKDDHQRALAEEVYQRLLDNGYDVLFDDRDERAGVKFKDADLIGIPLRLVIGKKSKERIIEYKRRRTEETGEMSVDKLMAHMAEMWSQL